jgi:superfamily II DNA or RNA helicase
MRVRIAGMAWLPKADLGPQGIAYFKKVLHIVPRKARAYDNTPPTPIDCWSETDTELGIPRDFFFATAKKEHDLVWDTAGGSKVEYGSKILHEGVYAEQGRAVGEILDWFGIGPHAPDVPSGGVGRHLGAIIKADPGFGKTNTALSIAHRMARTAVVIVHKERLLVQWAGRIEKFLPGARVGIVQEDKCQFEDRDIVIAMAQSLALEGQDGKRRYPQEFYDWPGLLVIDEIHRIGAPTWSPIPKMFAAQYRLGLSATPRRKDGADDVFWWHIGQIRYSAETEMPVPDVRVVESGARGPDIMRKEGVALPVVINVLSRLTWRNKQIVAEIVKALKSPQQRKLMVLSERLEHLRALDKMLLEACEEDGLKDITTGFYVGEWFTGEEVPRLVKGHWEMDDEGRDKAIETIYLTFRRRKALKAEKDADGARLIWLDDDWFDLDNLYNVPAHAEESIKAAVFKAADQALFKLAKEFKIAQRKREKKRPVTEAELFEAERARVMWVTYQMCGEGIDQPAVDTLGFATPVSDVEQAYGRGRRVCVPVREGGESTPEMCEHYCPWRAGDCKGKPKPMAFDIVDKHIIVAKKRRKHRLEFYRSVGAKLAGATS